ncbi:MAG: hypothetical protein ACOYMV_12890 [Verrucomicrobiia bacterium]
MKRSEINERLAKGALVLMGRYLGSKVETRTWVDRETGRKQESQVVQHNLELSGGSEVVRIVEYLDAGKPVESIGKRGDYLVGFPLAVERNKGGIVCRVNREDLHRVEE